MKRFDPPKISGLATPLMRSIHLRFALANAATS